jgi:hypothetical protein
LMSAILLTDAVAAQQRNDAMYHKQSFIRS